MYRIVKVLHDGQTHHYEVQKFFGIFGIGLWFTARSSNGEIETCKDDYGYPCLSWFSSNHEHMQFQNIHDANDWILETMPIQKTRIFLPEISKNNNH